MGNNEVNTSAENEVNVAAEASAKENQCGQRLPRLFRRTERLMHRYADSKRRDMFDAERGQGRLLALLKKTGPLAQKDIAYLMGIRPQSLGELVHKLQENGLVTRTPQSEDKRKMIVALTEAGEAVEMPKMPFEQVFECLNEEEQENLKGYLKKICRRLKELLPEDDMDFAEYDPYGPWGPDPRRCGGPRPPRPCGPNPGPGPRHHHHHAPEGPGYRGRDCFRRPADPWRM